MPTYRYQTLQVPLPQQTTAIPYTQRSTVGAAVRLLHMASKALSNWAVSSRVNKEIESRHAEIEAAMREYERKFPQHRGSVGVLLAIGLMEWAIPDATGFRAQRFNYLVLAGAGSDPRSVLTTYVDQSKLLPGVPRGWRPVTKYVWVTRWPSGENRYNELLP